MKKYLFVAALLLASCTRSVTPEMVARAGASKSGANVPLSGRELGSSAEVGSINGDAEVAKSNATNTSSRRKVRFEFDNGANAKQFFVVGGTISASQVPNDPVKTDHKFLGWSTKPGDESSIVNYVTSYKVVEDTTFYAVWQPFYRPVVVRMILDGAGTEDYVQMYQDSLNAGEVPLWDPPEYVDINAITNRKLGDFMNSSNTPALRDDRILYKGYGFQRIAVRDEWGEIDEAVPIPSFVEWIVPDDCGDLVRVEPIYEQNPLYVTVVNTDNRSFWEKLGDGFKSMGTSDFWKGFGEFLNGSRSGGSEPNVKNFYK